MASLPLVRVRPAVSAFTDVGLLRTLFGVGVTAMRSDMAAYLLVWLCGLYMLRSCTAWTLTHSSVPWYQCSNRRGISDSIRSNNGTNVGGSTDFNELISKWNHCHKLQEHLLLKEIRWEFNPAAASHMGGTWEHQIRSVHKIMNSVLLDQVLHDGRLDTVFCKAKRIIKSRPLTQVSDDPGDLGVQRESIERGNTWPATTMTFVNFCQYRSVCSIYHASVFEVKYVFVLDIIIGYSDIRSS